MTLRYICGMIWSYIRGKSWRWMILGYICGKSWCAGRSWAMFPAEGAVTTSNGRIACRCLSRSAGQRRTGILSRRASTHTGSIPGSSRECILQSHERPFACGCSSRRTHRALQMHSVGRSRIYNENTRCGWSCKIVINLSRFPITQ